MKDLKFFFGVVGIIVALGVIFYFFQLYYFFYQDVIKTENSILRHQYPLLLPNAKEDYVSTWGAFGDFVGGTLNPVIGLISVLLLFATWRVTSKTLDTSKKELRNSNELLNNQQFDAIFWGLFHNLKRIEEMLFKSGDGGQLKIDIIYYNVFLCQFNKRDKNHSNRRQIILKDAELSQYFICLYQIFKNIDERISFGNKEEEKKIKKAYSNILRASIPTKLLQLLAVNSHENFNEYKNFLEDFNFLEHMPFYIIEQETDLNLGLLECLTTYDERVFDRSTYYQAFKTKSHLNIFFEKKIQDYKIYINNSLMSKIYGEQFIEDRDINLKIFLNWDRENFRLIWWGESDGRQMRKEACNWRISMSGMEVDINGLKYRLVINSFSNQIIRLEKNPL